MSDLAKKLLTLFRGRHDHIAIGVGDSFEPAKEAPSELLLDRDHFTGGRCYGFYLLTGDGKVCCTCVDFDNKPKNPNPRYEAEALALCVALRSFSLSPLLERSQSGNGYHVWLFFSEPVPAYLPRAWWRAVAQRMQTEFAEVYPRQDAHVGKGIGNLVRYPLWSKSCFIDWESSDTLAVIDPTEALDGVQRLSPQDLPLLAHQLSMGELRAESVANVAVGTVAGDSTLLPLRVQKMLEGRKFSLLARRWNGDTDGMKDTSRSAVAMSIATELVRMYVPTPEIASAIRWWGRKAGSDKVERDGWIDTTVTKAYDFVLTRQEAASTADSSTFEKAALAFIDQLERTNGQMHLPTGIHELDLSIDGVSASEMVVIAARPGHGKSAFTFQVMQNAANAGVKGLLISEEMSAMEIGKRRLLSIADATQEMWGASIANQLRHEVVEYHKGLEPVHVVEGCNTIDRVEEVIDQFVSVHGVGIVAVDYLQLLTGRHGDRYEVVTEMSRRLKRCAGTYKIPILVLSQLNRAVEGRQDNEPKLSDLRESGQIEQDADLILFLQWPSKFDPSVLPNVYRIYAAKRRNGPIRTPRIETKFDPSRQLIGRDSDVPYRGG